MAFAYFREARHVLRRVTLIAASLALVPALTPACSGHEPEVDESGTGGFGSGNGGTGASGASTGGGTGATPSSGNGGVASGNGGAPGGSGAGSAAGNGGAPGTPTSCVNFVDGFRPQVFEPVCSNCHGKQPKLPNIGVASVAIANCSFIGTDVRRGIMPPDGSGLSLTAEQRALVASWVAEGCPETAADAAKVCAPPAATGGASGAGGTPGTPGTGGAPATGGIPGTPPGTTDGLAIDRAEWDSEKEVLRVEGTCDDAAATLTAEFTGRSEPVTNAQGRFRAQFSGVVARPPAVTVKASSGAAATAAVVAK